MEKKKSEHIQSVQILRGFAAIWVVMYHNGYSHIANPGPLVQFLDKDFSRVYIFFIISGFILPYTMMKARYTVSEFWSFFTKRLVRIEPPYLASIVLILFLNWTNTITPWYKGPAYTINWLNLAGHLGYINAFINEPWLNVAYWTLCVDLEYYVMIALLFPLITHKDKRIIFATCAALIAVSFIPVGNPHGHVLRYIPLFLTGISLFY